MNILSQEKILIVGPAWVGDMVMAQTLFKLLKQQNENVIIDVVAPTYTVPLLERMPEVSNAIPLPLKHGELGLRTRYEIGRLLRHKGYSQAIVLPNSFKSALIPFIARIPKRTGWRGEWRYVLLNDVRVLDKQKYPLMIERFLALGLPKGAQLSKPYPWPLLQVEKSAVEQAAQKFNLDLNKPVLAICPGAEFGPSKQWPAEYCAEVANEKLAAGWQVWLFGSKKDAIVSEVIMNNTENRCVDLAGKTAMGEAIDLLSLAKVVLTNDSGLMHVAAGLQRPLVAVYGSSSPGFTPPLLHDAKILSLGLACSPCFKRQCPLGHRKCMRDLKPGLVMKAIDGVGEGL